MNLKAIDFFCSGGGMTFGMKKAGINVIAGIDNDKDVQETYEKNNPGSKFILADIYQLKTKDLYNKIENIKKNDDELIFIGCSPCQYWSLINTDKEKSKDSKDLLKEFQRFVKYYRPGHVIVENVPGIVRKAKESGLDQFIDELKKFGYVVNSEIYNLNEYGVPQSRKRFSLIASRIVKSKIIPKKSKNKKTVIDYIGIKNGFPKIKAGNKDNTCSQNIVANLNEENLKTITLTPKNGGNSVKKRHKYNGNGFKDSYSRMAWDKPSPTITTKFYSISNGRFGHPDENRAISIREGATLQTFPKDYIFYSKSISTISKMIGNAVPPEFAKRIGKSIINELRND